MLPQDTAPGRDAAAQGERTDAADRRRESLVAEMVKGAVLPRLLARKDDGAFDHGPNVVRFPGDR